MLRTEPTPQVATDASDASTVTAAIPPLAFGFDYLEPIALTDGRPARVVALRPEHAQLVKAGFARLSARTRYLRFFGAKRELTDADLQRLLAFDGIERYALAVLIDGPSGPEGLAVGRLARSDNAPDLAEVAITVIDQYQRFGLGRLLLDRLQAAAAERGYTRAGGQVLAENRPMLGLLRDTVPNLRTRLEGTIVNVEWPLPKIAPRVHAPRGLHAA